MNEAAGAGEVGCPLPALVNHMSPSRARSNHIVGLKVVFPRPGDLSQLEWQSVADRSADRSVR